MKTTGVRTRNLYDPGSKEPYAVSRSKLALFLECPRCFYLDRRLGIGRVDGMTFSLNLAVDALLKREFDRYRLNGEPHPIMQTYGIEAVPFKHKDLTTWRDTPGGIRFLHHPTNFDVFGIIDDLWEHRDGSIAVVDYKATSTPAILTLDHQDGYMRQLEIYQWLLRQNGLFVSETAYILYANANREREAFDRKLEFSLQILPYEGSDVWVEDALRAAHEVLMADVPPSSSSACPWCQYRRAASGAEEMQ